MNKVHIYGGTGFLGRALAPLLSQADIPYVVYSSRTMDLTTKDIRREVRDGDIVIMLAALTPEKTDAIKVLELNTRMMTNLLSVLRDCSLAHFIYVSTDAVYPLTADIIDERTPPCPESLYGYAHAVREQCAREHFPAEKLAIFRPCAIYGEGDTHNAYGISRFLRSAHEHGRIELFGGGEEYRDHVHVDDVASVLCDALLRRVSGTFNVASGKSWRFSEIAAAIQSGIGKSVSIVNKPRAMPVFHRHVDICGLRAAFPSCRPRSIGEGIEQSLKAAAA